MALWPFGKKNKDEQTEAAAPAAENPAGTSTDKEPAATASAPETAAKSADAAEASASAGPAGAVHAVEHDAINGDMGPFDGDSVDISQFNFEDFSVGLLDLGSVRIPLPKGSQVQVEMGETGPRMLHILTPHGRMTPVAFAAPRTSGQWAESAADILSGLESDGFSAQLEDGPWGSEIVGSNDKGGIRIIGVEGPRWMYRLTLAAPAGKEAELAQLGREVVARTFVYRGEDPILAGNPLPVVLPQQLAEQVQQALQQRQQQAEANGSAAPSTEGQEEADAPRTDAEAQARQQLKDLED
ncbi:DUF3710 domain-containing protein [Corynebacterium sp.]|uniref:DUF3710 domain-containing protein n=1 Tax=Corynebacterium sp. TaxID=1720 RepID=UPI0027B95EBE|nr:DUF3710 domain-containing protein [Corynebacterium sp.]